MLVIIGTNDYLAAPLYSFGGGSTPVVGVVPTKNQVVRFVLSRDIAVF